MKENKVSPLSCFWQRLTTPKQNYPYVDFTIVVYCGFVLLVQVLLQVSPFVTFLATTPFYSIQTYLGLLGGGLIVLDLFTTKRIWQGKYSIFLYVILALAAVASLRTISYGVKENLFKLCWAAIQFVLIYSCSLRMSREKLVRFIKIIFYSLLAIWLVTCIVSLYQYVIQVGYKYVVNPLAKDSSANRQGFYDHRLFGIFYTLNHAAYGSLMFGIGAFFYLIKSKRLYTKLLLGLAELILISHILLTGSRSASISLHLCIAMGGWMLLRNWAPWQGWKKHVLTLVMALAITVVGALGLAGLKNALAYVPDVAEKLSYRFDDDESASSDSNNATETAPPENNNSAETAPPENNNSAETAPPENNNSAETTPPESNNSAETAPPESNNSAETAPPESNNSAETTPPKSDESSDSADRLDREGLEEDVSNGRLDIWAAYFSLYKEVGPIGLSPGNYMPYIFENHPDLYVVEYIKENYPDKYDSGIIHHVHSGYLMVFVSSGWLGAACLLAFILLCILCLIRFLRSGGKASHLLISCLMIVMSCAFSAVLDEGLFFQNPPHTTLFWLALGILLRECQDSISKETAPQRFDNHQE